MEKFTTSLPPAPGPAEPSGAQTVSRAIHALKLIASRHTEGVRLVDVADALGLTRPTAHRLLKTLTEEGLLRRLGATRRYVLGALVFELGLAAAHNFNLVDMCRPTLQRLAERTSDTSFLFVRSGNDSVCLDRIQGTFPIQTPSVPVGSRQPLGVNAGGLALLCALGDGEARAVAEACAPCLGAYAGLDADELLRIRQRARNLGYALIGNRAVPGVTAVGLPVISHSGAAIAAITVATTSSRMTQPRIDEILPHLRDAAREIAQLLRQ